MAAAEAMADPEFAAAVGRTFRHIDPLSTGRLSFEMFLRWWQRKDQGIEEDFSDELLKDAFQSHDASGSGLGELELAGLLLDLELEGYMELDDPPEAAEPDEAAAEGPAAEAMADPDFAAAVRRTFRHIDAAAAGRLSFEMFLGWWQSKGEAEEELSEELLKDAFQSHDASGFGLGELAAARPGAGGLHGARRSARGGGAGAGRARAAAGAGAGARAGAGRKGSVH